MQKIQNHFLALAPATDILFPMKGCAYFVVRLLLGHDTKVSLTETHGICAIFVNDADTTTFTGMTWKEALLKVRDFAFETLPQHHLRRKEKLSPSHDGQMSDSQKNPASQTVSAKTKGEVSAPTNRGQTEYNEN